MEEEGGGAKQPRSQGGGAGGVPTTPSGINDIHNFNYLIQERPFDIVSSLASEPQIAPEALSWHENLKKFLQHAPRPPRYIIYTVPPLHRFRDLHPCSCMWEHMTCNSDFQIGVHYEFVTLLYLILLCMVYASLHERGFMYMHTPHQHANSTPPFRKVAC